MLILDIGPISANKRVSDYIGRTELISFSDPLDFAGCYLARKAPCFLHQKRRGNPPHPCDLRNAEKEIESSQGLCDDRSVVLFCTCSDWNSGISGHVMTLDLTVTV